MFVVWVLVVPMMMVASVVLALVVMEVMEMTRLILFLVVGVTLAMVVGMVTMMLLLMVLLACVPSSVVPLCLHNIACRGGEYAMRVSLSMLNIRGDRPLRSPHVASSVRAFDARLRPRRRSRPIMI